VRWGGGLAFLRMRVRVVRTAVRASACSVQARYNQGSMQLLTTCQARHARPLIEPVIVQQCQLRNIALFQAIRMLRAMALRSATLGGKSVSQSHRLRNVIPQFRLLSPYSNGAAESSVTARTLVMPARLIPSMIPMIVLAKEDPYEADDVGLPIARLCPRSRLS
jgi:hypothetical protein